MTMTSQRPNQYQGWLEGLRGIAILSVVIHHYGLDSLVETFGAAWTHWFNFGTFGVALFFCISGYIITYSLGGRSREYVAPFVLKRVFRLYPAYIAGVLLAIVVYQPPVRDAILNFTMIQRFLGARDINGVFWTLQVEFVFYSVCAAMLLFGGLSSRRLLAALVACVSLSVLCGFCREFIGIKAPSAVAIGLTIIFLSAYVRHQAGITPNTVLPAAFALVGIVLSVLWSYSKDWGYQENPERFLVSYAAAFITFGICARSRFDLGPVPSALGRVSYSLYLVHQPVMAVAAATTQYAGIPVIALAFAVSVGLSYVLYTFVEVPGLRLGRQLMRSRTITA